MHDPALHIRPCEEADLPVLRQLVAELHESLCPLDPDLAPTDQIIGAHFAHLLEQTRKSGGTIALAVVGGDIAGYACLFGRVLAHDLDEVQTPFACLAEIYVRSAWQGHAIGTALLEHAEAFARGLGVPKLELGVLARNAGARRFYQREGYTERVLTLVKRFDQA